MTAHKDSSEPYQSRIHHTAPGGTGSRNPSPDRLSSHNTGALPLPKHDRPSRLPCSGWCKFSKVFHVIKKVIVSSPGARMFAGQIYANALPPKCFEEEPASADHRGGIQLQPSQTWQYHSTLLLHTIQKVRRRSCSSVFRIPKCLAAFPCTSQIIFLRNHFYKYQLCPAVVSDPVDPPMILHPFNQCQQIPLPQIPSLLGDNPISNQTSRTTKLPLKRSNKHRC